MLDDAAAEGATALLCLGDIVGYGADPAACLELVAERAQVTIAGNHEHGVAGKMSLAWFNPTARLAAQWTRDRLPLDNLEYLASLPLSARVGDGWLVHGSPRHPEEWDYLVEAEDGFEVFGDFDSRLCFVGHSHQPRVWSVGSSGPRFARAFREWPLRIPLQDGRRYVINIGSVGQPRDADSRAGYAIWDEDARQVWLRRVGYDHRAAAAKIVAAGLPRILADRLAHGR